ncbi:MAG: PEP-CTERM sorting domain-containing protein [Verrucomicrobia bacterium]|nr:PEP-CTERM sorting domain-containing protein [Verrucomicrobiota bacterium]
MKTKHILTKPLFALAGLALCASSAQAYTAGDLVLFFQKSGAANTFQIDLGLATNYRQPTGNLINIANINAGLTAAFSNANWYDDTGLVWGAVGVRSSSPNTTFVSGGDPNQTVYVSATRSPIGTVGTASSAQWALNPSDLSGVSSAIITQNNVVTGTLTAASGATNTVNTNNPFLTANQLDNAYGAIFAGGVGQFFTAGSYGTLGGLPVEGALDLSRILATTGTGGTTAYTGDGATVGNGAFEGTFVITQSGNVSYLVAPVPEPGTVGILAGSTLLGLVRRRRSRSASHSK